MQEPAGITKLSAFPRNQLIERELFVATVSEVDLLAALGAPSGESQPALGQGRPLFFWDLAFSCGLLVGLQFDQIDQRLTAFLDEPDVDHAIRHLGVALSDLWLLETDAPASFAAVCPPPDRSYRLRRGGGEVLATGLTERDARCRLEDAAAGGDLTLVVESAGTDDGSATPSGSDEAIDGADAARDQGSALTDALARRVVDRPDPDPDASIPPSFDPTEPEDVDDPWAALETYADEDFGDPGA